MGRAISSRWRCLVLLLVIWGLGSCDCVTQIGPPDPDPTPEPPNDIKERLVKATRVDPFANLRWLCYSSDAKYILMEDVGDIHVVDARTLERKGYRGAKEPRGCPYLKSLATFPDQNLCVGGALDGMLYVLTIPDLEIVKEMKLPVKVIDEDKIDRGSRESFKGIGALQISPDGRYLALRFQGNSYHIPPEQLGVWIYDTQTWELKHILRRGDDGFPGCVYEPAEFLFHPNGKEMLVSFRGGLISNRKYVDKLTEAEIEQIEANLKQAGITPGTQWTEVFCFDIESGGRTWRLWKSTGAAASYDFSTPRNESFFYGTTQDDKGQVVVAQRQWNGSRPGQQSPPPGLEESSFKISPDGKTLAFLGRHLTLWHANDHRQYFRARLPAQTRFEDYATFSPDSKHLVFVQGGEVLYLVNIEPDFKQPAASPPGASPPGQAGDK